jgi:hypothetical protein
MKLPPRICTATFAGAVVGRMPSGWLDGKL